jgi:hypothetical protein
VAAVAGAVAAALAVLAAAVAVVLSPGAAAHPDRTSGRPRAVAGAGSPTAPAPTGSATEVPLGRPPVQVRPPALTAYLNTDAVRYGRAVRVAGVLVAGPGSRLRLERSVGGRWRRVDETRTRADRSYAFDVTPTSPGFWRWRVVRAAHGRAARLVAPLPRLDAFRLHTYSVTVRGAVRADVETFRADVASTYADPRGWPRAHHRFREVPTGGAFTVVLARPAYLPRFAWFCSPAYSCQASRYVVINAARWAHGSRFFTGSLDTYRRYVVDHETGHWLGLGHARCPRHGAPAPVMQQQSKGMQGCRPNAWPLPREVRAVS